jgi:hypothetical protein
MPQEITNKMGIIYRPLPDDKLRQKDQDLLSVLYSLLSIKNKEIVKTYLGEDYINYIERKATKLEAIKDNKLVNLSEVK